MRPEKDLDLFVGAEVLAAADPGYRPGRENLPGRPGHSLAAIENALKGYRPPPTTKVDGLRDAFDAFAGYLVLDAVIANQDRHDENWAVLRGAVDYRLDCLSPSYDHASSLGFNLTDERREQEQRRDGLATWAVRGAGTRFEHAAGGRPATLVEVANSALARASVGACELWRGRLAALDIDAVAAVAARVPRMSDPARTFAVRLVDTNRRRLLDVPLDPPA